jgi:ribosomal protein S18 acetylase RimI-like enzyme
MSNHQTSFSLEDAEALLSRLTELDLTICQEWQAVENQWANLQSVWRDRQHDDFEPILTDLIETYRTITKDCSEYRLFIMQQIDIIQKRNTRLQTLVIDGIKKGKVAIQIAQVLTNGAMQNAPVNTQNPIQDNAETATAIRSEINRYSTYVRNDRSREADRRQTEQESATTNADRAVAAGSPPNNIKPANQLEYKTQINGSSIYIRAFDANNIDTGDMLNARIEADGRVYISDINVGEANRRSGIGSQLLQALEDRLPEGTTIYFTENQAPEFWAKNGFHSNETEMGKIEYIKQSS